MLRIVTYQKACRQRSSIFSSQHLANGSCGEGATGSVKSLLSRWREKVFVLLVQQKLQQIQDNRERLEARAKVSSTSGIGLLGLQQSLDCSSLSLFPKPSLKSGKRVWCSEQHKMYF